MYERDHLCLCVWTGYVFLAHVRVHCTDQQNIPLLSTDTTHTCSEPTKDTMTRLSVFLSRAIIPRLSLSLCTSAQLGDSSRHRRLDLLLAACLLEDCIPPSVFAHSSSSASIRRFFFDCTTRQHDMCVCVNKYGRTCLAMTWGAGSQTMCNWATADRRPTD